jgi:hypothetical protein
MDFCVVEEVFEFYYFTHSWQLLVELKSKQARKQWKKKTAGCQADMVLNKCLLNK